MDVDKQAAKSKWQQNRRYKQKSRGGKSSAPPRPVDRRHANLSSNADRFTQEDNEDAHASKSAGLDLQQLLNQHKQYDPHFHHKTNFNLLDQYNLPPPSEQEVLALDVVGLAACLASVPLSTVLRLDHPLQDDSSLKQQVDSSTPPNSELQQQLQQRKQQSTSLPQQPEPKQQPTAQLNEDELDEILGLGSNMKPTRQIRQQQKEQPADDLGDWLDSL